jgi:hypothetical protein
MEQSERRAEQERQRLWALHAVSYQTLTLALFEIKEAFPNAGASLLGSGQGSYLGGFFRQKLAEVKSFFIPSLTPEHLANIQFL